MTNDETLSACNTTVQRAAHLMVNDFGADAEMVLDRFLTYSIAQMVLLEGPITAAEHLRDFADRVENGAMDKIRPRHPQS